MKVPVSTKATVFRGLSYQRFAEVLERGAILPDPNVPTGVPVVTIADDYDRSKSKSLIYAVFQYLQEIEKYREDNSPSKRLPLPYVYIVEALVDKANLQDATMEFRDGLSVLTTLMRNPYGITKVYEVKLTAELIMAAYILYQIHGYEDEGIYISIPVFNNIDNYNNKSLVQDEAEILFQEVIKTSKVITSLRESVFSETGLQPVKEFLKSNSNYMILEEYLT